MANPKVTVEINGKDNLSPTIKRATVNLKEMGEKVSQLGMRFGAAFTLPLIGAGMALNKFGSEAVKTVKETQDALNEAIAGGDGQKIAEARQAYAALSPEVLRAAEAYKQMQTAIQPAMAAIDGVKVQLLEVMARVLKDMSPYITMAAEGFAKLVNQFINLPVPTQNFILGMLGFVAAAPIVITAVGQVIGTIGILKDLLIVMPGLSTAAGTAIKGLGTVMGGVATGPVALLVAGIGALVLLFQSGWVDKAIDAFNQLAWIIAYGWGKTLGLDVSRMALPTPSNLAGTKANGGPVRGGGTYLVGERGPEIFTPRSSGTIIPNHQLAGAGGNITIVYSPTMSTASPDEIENMASIIKQALRRQR